MMMECHSPQPKCISIPICHPVICCCNCPTNCICIPNCCEKTPSSLNYKTDICDDLLESKRTYEFSYRDPSTPYVSMPTKRIFSSQLRNSTPDIRKIYSKTNSYFNINNNNSNDNFFNNNLNPLNSSDKYNDNYFNNDNNYDINNNTEEINKKSFSFKPNLSISRNNSINYTYRKKFDSNRELIKNKSNLNKNHKLLDKIKCISHRLDKTISIYNNKNKGNYNKNRIGSNKNIHDYNRRFNSNENIHNFNKSRKNKNNINSYLNEMNQIRLKYDKNYILEKMKKNNEREKRMIEIKLKNLSDVINNGNNAYKKITNNIIEMEKKNPKNNMPKQNKYYIDNRININDINKNTVNDNDNQEYEEYEENEENEENEDNL